MNTTAIGRQAEAAAAQYLGQRGYRILSQNWQSRYCEIDLVATKQAIIYFVEVKYRRTKQFGSGFEYVTSQKLRQMQFAASVWVHTYGWNGDYRLGAVQVKGPDFTVTGCLLDL